MDIGPGSKTVVLSNDGFEVFEVVDGGFRIPSPPPGFVMRPMPPVAKSVRAPDEDEFVSFIVEGL